MKKTAKKVVKNENNNVGVKHALLNYCGWIWLLILTVISTVFGLVFFGAMIYGIVQIFY